MGPGWMMVWRSDIWSRIGHEFRVDGTTDGAGAAEAQVGQITFLYVTQPVGGIVAVLSVARPPRVPATDIAAAHPWAKTVVDYTVQAVLDPPVPIRDLRSDELLGASYPVRRNMNLTIAPLTEDETGALVALCEERQPGLTERLAKLEPVQPSLTFETENELEQWFVSQIDALSMIDCARYRLANGNADGIAGRQPTLPSSDTRPDLVLVDDIGPDHQQFVVVEIKNGPARPEHVGQLAHYVSWIRQHLTGAADARGLLLTTGTTLAANTALQLVPAISHHSVADVVNASPPPPFKPADYEITDLMRGASNSLANTLTCFVAMLESRSFVTRDGEPDLQRVWSGLSDDLDRLWTMLESLGTHDDEASAPPT